MAEAKENKTQAQAEEKPPESTSTAIVIDKRGRELLQEKGSGKFIAKKKPLLPAIEFTRKERKFLSSFSNDPDPQFKGLTEHEVAFRHIVRIAQGKGSGDPKADMAAVKAYEVAMRRALGKEAPSEQELDKLTNQPVKSIIIIGPEIMHPEIVKEKEKVKEEQPKFAEVLSVKTDEKK